MCHYNTKPTEKIASMILDAREKRALRQAELIEKYHLPVISFTINAPGENKNNEIINEIFLFGREALLSLLNLENIKIVAEFTSEALPSGPEAIFSLEADAIRLKELSLSIEEHHPLGRLFDIDIIDCDLNPISRKNLGYEGRKCIVCNNDAKVCARSQRHDISDVIACFNRIYDDYIRSSG
jgi:holo-ACP synthase